MNLAVESVRIFLLLGYTMFCVEGKTYSICDESIIPVGTESLNLDIDLPVDKLKTAIEHSEDTIIKIIVNDVPFTLEHYRIICRLPNLKSLEIRSERTRNDYIGFSKICPPRRLESLSIINELAGDRRLESSQWDWVFCISTLRSLNLDFDANLTNTDMFKHLPGLNYLSLPSRGNITVDALRGLRQCESLKSIGITNSDRLSEQNFEDVAAIPNLTMIELIFASKIDHLHLLKSAKRLEWLILSRDFVDSDDFTSLVEDLKSVKIVGN